MARRVLAVAVLAASVAVLAVAVAELVGQRTTRPPASRADVYAQLAQQLKGHLQPLVTTLRTPKNHAPTIQVPQQQGYGCAVATTGCSLHPCVKYVQSTDPGVVVPSPGPGLIVPSPVGQQSAVAPSVRQAQSASSGCRKAAGAVRINAP